MASGYTFFWKGLPATSRRIHGVRFAIRTTLLQTLPESPVAISERLMTLRIPLAKHRYATFISTYAPTPLSDDETKDHYYAIHVNAGTSQGQAHCTWRFQCKNWL